MQVIAPVVSKIQTHLRSELAVAQTAIAITL